VNADKIMDYTYPSVYFAYFFFFIVASGALFFFFRTYKHGYFGKDSEEVKFRMLNDENEHQHSTELQK